MPRDLDEQALSELIRRSPGQSLPAWVEEALLAAGLSKDMIERAKKDGGREDSIGH
jgi:hypothetical protein